MLLRVIPRGMRHFLFSAVSLCLFTCGAEAADAAIAAVPPAPVQREAADAPETAAVTEREAARPTQATAPVPAKPAAKAARPGRRAATTSRPAAGPAGAPAPAESEPKAGARIEVRRAYSDAKGLYDEAKNLLIADQRYLIRYEDEEGYGRVSPTAANAIATDFSSGEVQRYRDAVGFITDYRNEVKGRCPSASNQALVRALDRYADGLASFHRRALSLAGDISTSNNVMVLVVNRTTLRDAAVLFSRYLRFKKQRFKDVMEKFVPTDNQLIQSFVTVAKTVKVEISDDDWNRPYTVRETALEAISAWPRDFIFEASQKLADLRENVCLVDLLKKAE